MIVQRGRFLTAADGKDAPPVAVINQALARRDFPDEDPIGRRVRWGTSGWATVIGVAGNTKGFGVAGDQMPEVYFANGQTRWGNGVEVLVRTAVPPLSLASAVRKEMRSWNKRMIIGEVDTLDHMLAESVAVPRFYLLLVVAFAVMALLVSAVGLYGTVNYSVARRTHEIGVRMALGAQRGDVLGMILWQGLGLIAFGLALGLAGAWVSTRLLQTLLFGVQPDDATAFICGSAVLVLAVLLACYIPARRATRVDPLVALRHE
jgi:putative ABC transport system permease protein